MRQATRNTLIALSHNEELSPELRRAIRIELGDVPPGAAGDTLDAMRKVVLLYLPPDSGITADECLDKLIELLDQPGTAIGEARR